MKRLDGKPFALIGINSDKDREALKKTVIAEKITWRSWWDQGRIDGPIHTRWQVEQRPAIHILDAQGVIRYRNIQLSSEVDAAIEQLLGEMASG